jgi:hypothetical protein
MATTALCGFLSAPHAHPASTLMEQSLSLEHALIS